MTGTFALWLDFKVRIRPLFPGAALTQVLGTVFQVPGTELLEPNYFVLLGHIQLFECHKPGAVIAVWN